MVWADDAVAQRLIKAGNGREELVGLSTTFATDVPQLYLDIDRTKVKSLNVPMDEVFKTLEICLGSFYVNQYNKYGRVYRVYLQVESSARDNIADISELYVRNEDGKMIPLSALVKVKHITGPETIQHYNIYPAAMINGNPAPGRSTGEAIAALEEVADEVLPVGMSYEWTGIMYQQLKAGNLAPVIFALALVFVFLFLAAQYESWTAPFMVMLAVPLAIFGVVPLVIASGAGAATRQLLGTTVFGGMLFSTLVSLILVPVLFVCIQKLRERAMPRLKPDKE